MDLVNLLLSQQSSCELALSRIHSSSGLFMPQSKGSSILNSNIVRDSLLPSLE